MVVPPVMKVNTTCWKIVGVCVCVCVCVSIQATKPGLQWHRGPNTLPPDSFHHYPLHPNVQPPSQHPNPIPLLNHTRPNTLTWFQPSQRVEKQLDFIHVCFHAYFPPPWPTFRPHSTSTAAPTSLFPDTCHNCPAPKLKLSDTNTRTPGPTQTPTSLLLDLFTP